MRCPRGSSGRTGISCYLGCNAAFARDAGFADPKDVIGKDDYQLAWRDQADRYRADDRQVVESGCAKTLIEEPQTRLGGNSITLLTNKVPLRDSMGKVRGVLGVYLDITSRKQAEAALKDSDLRYRRLFEAARDGILILDAETGAVVDVNPFLVELLGFSRETFLGKALWDLGFFRDIIANKDSFEILRAEGYIRYEDKPLETKDGRRIDVEFVSNVYQVNGHEVIQCNVRDISTRKRAEEALRESERMLAESQRYGHVGSWFWKLTGPFEWSAETYRIYGVSPHSFIPTPEAVLSLVHPDDRPAMQSWLVDSTAGDDHELEFRVTRPDGTVQVLLGRGKAVAGIGNAHAYMAGTVQDITERKQVEETLARSQRELVAVFDAVADGILLAETEGGKFHSANASICRMFGYSRDEMLDLGVSDLLCREDAAEGASGIWATRKGGVHAVGQSAAEEEGWQRLLRRYRLRTCDVGRQEPARGSLQGYHRTQADGGRAPTVGAAPEAPCRSDAARGDRIRPRRQSAGMEPGGAHDLRVLS